MRELVAAQEEAGLDLLTDGLLAAAGSLPAAGRGERGPRRAPADALPRHEHVLPRPARRRGAAPAPAAARARPARGPLAGDAAGAARARACGGRSAVAAGSRRRRPRAPDRGVCRRGLRARRPRRPVPRPRRRPGVGRGRPEGAPARRPARSSSFPSATRPAVLEGLADAPVDAIGVDFYATAPRRRPRELPDGDRCRRHRLPQLGRREPGRDRRASPSSSWSEGRRAFR